MAACFLYLGFASVGCKTLMLITNAEMYKQPLETVLVVVEDIWNLYGDKLY